MTCEHWPWWVLLHTKGQRHHLQKEKDRPPPQTPTKSFTSFPINYWHAVVRWKASQTFRWSVWWIFQLTNRPPDTLHQSNVVAHFAHMHICIHMYYMQLHVVITVLFWMFYLLFIYIHFPLDSVFTTFCFAFLTNLQTVIHNLKQVKLLTVWHATLAKNYCICFGGM